uniref:Protein phosphatase 1, regulatory (inhibitor) subunit 14Aa n=1 Tax=Pygocentrus nattereri TaxID=42514 RepID=A0AAR2J014_PYGNA
MAEDGSCRRREESDRYPRAGALLSAQKRQARVTVKYNRKELQRRLNVETWIEDALEDLYAGAEDEMPEEIDIDDLLVLQSNEERAQKLQELLQTCRNDIQAFPSGGVLEPIPVVIGRKAGYTLDRSAVHRRADSHSHPHTQGQFSMSNRPDCMSLDCGRKPENPEETHADTGRTLVTRTQALLTVRHRAALANEILHKILYEY